MTSPSVDSNPPPLSSGTSVPSPPTTPQTPPSPSKLIMATVHSSSSPSPSDTTNIHPTSALSSRKYSSSHERTLQREESTTSPYDAFNSYGNHSSPSTLESERSGFDDSNPTHQPIRRSSIQQQQQQQLEKEEEEGEEEEQQQQQYQYYTSYSTMSPQSQYYDPEPFTTAQPYYQNPYFGTAGYYHPYMAPTSPNSSAAPTGYAYWSGPHVQSTMYAISGSEGYTYPSSAVSYGPESSSSRFVETGYRGGNTPYVKTGRSYLRSNVSSGSIGPSSGMATGRPSSGGGGAGTFRSSRSSSVGSSSHTSSGREVVPKNMSNLYVRGLSSNVSDEAFLELCSP